MSPNEQLWLDLTNIGLGIAVAVLIIAVALAGVLDLTRTVRKARSGRRRAA
jgi:hypothetical protein